MVASLPRNGRLLTVALLPISERLEIPNTPYAEVRESRSINEPWVAHNVEQADRVVEIAERIWRERRNEAGWRFALEPEIFSRFKFEAAW